MLENIRKLIARVGIRVILLIGFDVAMVIGIVAVIARGGTTMAAAMTAIVIVVTVIFILERAYKFRYMVPGVLLMVIFVLYPIIHTVYLSFTNYGTGHLLTKDQAVQILEDRYYLPEESRTFTFDAYRNEEGDIQLLLSPEDSEQAYLTGGQRLRPVNLDDPRFADQDGDGTIDEINGYTRLSRGELVQIIGTLEGLTPEADDFAVQMQSLTRFAEAVQRYDYVPAEDHVVDNQTGEVFVPVEGTFTAVEGERTLQPGYRVPIGIRNYREIFTNPLITQPFFRVFGWTFLWAFLSVATTFTLGLMLALNLNEPTLAFKKIYRSLLIIPYAMPIFITALMWRGFFNTSAGMINTRILQPLLGIAPAWFQEPVLAKVAILIVNLWLGFPYMMVITLGALQSIPPQLYDVAKVDGASGPRQFFEITLPLLLLSVGPLLIGSFAFNFNNFNVIFLVTEGNPPIVGANVAGSTDILISYTYKLAFGGQGGTLYGFAAAVSVIIFLIVGTISGVNFRFTGALEEMGENV
jgi:ABC-type sugar transport system permease subunit